MNWSRQAATESAPGPSLLDHRTARQSEWRAPRRAKESAVASSVETLLEQDSQAAVTGLCKLEELALCGPIVAATDAFQRRFHFIKSAKIPLSLGAKEQQVFLARSRHLD